VQRILIVVIIVFVVVAFMTTYTVRFTETAVVTTFGKAGEGAVKTDPGLKLTIPYIQNVTKYDKRSRYLESKPETQQTADSSQVVVTAFITWRVHDPKLFYQTFSGAGDRAASHYRAAEKMVGDQLRPAMGEISKFRFDELLSASGGSRLGNCEEAMLNRIVGDKGVVSPLAAAGIEAQKVGIISIELPEDTTKAVFERMKASRTRIAQDAVSQGKATAETIRKNAEADAQTIMAFAERRANNIRSRGEAEAAKFLTQLNEQPDLAVFIKNMELMRDAYARNITLVIPAGPTGWPGFALFRPDALRDLKPGQIPGLNLENLPTGQAPKAVAPGTTPTGASPTGSPAAAADPKAGGTQHQ
jgi:membrane protease subunit HflC